MENDIFTASLATADQSHRAFNEVYSHMFSGTFMQANTIEHNTHDLMVSNSLPSTMQREMLNTCYAPNSCDMPRSGMLISKPMLHPTISSYTEGCNKTNDIGTSISSTMPMNLLPSNMGSGESLSINNSSTSPMPLSMKYHDNYSSFNSWYPISRAHNYNIPDSVVHDEFLKVISTVHPSYYVTGSTAPCWNNSLPQSELSLSLGSSQPSIICVSDHCSEKSCSVVSQVTRKESEELSLYCGPSSTVHFSHVLTGSRYINVAQQMLAEVVSYILGNSEEINYPVSGIENEVRIFSSSCSRDEHSSEAGFEGFASSGNIKSLTDKEHLVVEENKAEGTKLVAFLRMVDHRYMQCLDRIHNVITTFRDATNSGSPQKLARFTLHTVASAFKRLRERITRHILLVNQGRIACMGAEERAFESPFIEKQWALQLGRKDQQSWRPQKGLPERSVSVLRAWMFQNFLHPYPKDNDKDLLAVQSGLTRSQVSNWFINARVRLWKPMIEELYSEIRKQQTVEDTDGDHGIHRNINNQMP